MTSKPTPNGNIMAYECYKILKSNTVNLEMSNLKPIFGCVLFGLMINLSFIGCSQPKSTNNKMISNTLKKNNDTTHLDMTQFVSNYNFDQFMVDKISKKNPKLQINTKVNNFTRRYRTMIHESFAKHEVNFSGQYIVNYWGCGSPCQVGVAINAQNGQIIELPSASGGYDFRKNSRLLILNPPDSLGYYLKDCSFCQPETYVLDTIKQRFIKLKE
jgi:hypothetical protein